MSESHDNEKVHYVYDGIEERDNRLPNWWLGILWGTVFFALGYWVYYEVARLGPDSLTSYQQQMEKLQAAAASRPVTDDLLVTLARDQAVLAEGKATFTQTCAACHGAQAQGVIGPNLTDAYWLHGNKPLQIHTSIMNGWLDKGMPAWGQPLGPERIKKVTAYLLSIRNSNVPGKEPQGEQLQ